MHAMCTVLYETFTFLLQRVHCISLSVKRHFANCVRMQSRFNKVAILQE